MTKNGCQLTDPVVDEHEQGVSFGALGLADWRRGQLGRVARSDATDASADCEVAVGHIAARLLCAAVVHRACEAGRVEGAVAIIALLGACVRFDFRPLLSLLSCCDEEIVLCALLRVSCS